MFKYEDVAEPIRHKIAKILKPWEKHSRYRYNAGFKSKKKYLNDVDIRINSNLSPTHDMAYYTYMIQSLIKTQLNDSNIFFDEFECGIDKDFFFNIQINTNGDMVNYNRKKIKEKLKKLYLINRLTRDEYKKIKLYLVEKPTLIQSVHLCSILQKHTLLSWTKREVINGEKKLYNGPVLKLKDTLYQTRVTLKFIMKINENYIDVDLNFFFKRNKYGVVNDIRMCCIGQNERTYDVFTIVKYVIRKRFYKVLKRIRTTFSVKMAFLHEYTPKKQKEIRQSIKDISDEINSLADTDIGLINHCAHQCDIMITLMKKQYVSKDDVAQWYKQMQNLLPESNIHVSIENLMKMKNILTKQADVLVYPKIEYFYNKYDKKVGNVFSFDLMKLIKAHYKNDY